MAQTELILEPSAAEFDAAVLKSEEPVLVDFWATWCGPCRRIAPVIEQIAGQYSGSLRVAKVDVDRHPELAQQYGVQSIPTLLFFKGGKVVDQAVGALPKAQLDAKIAALI
jgi:thioredoxin 1